ncbi:hypothetical protein Mal48_22470 [Thalassoglobus polymorphus]|uniref:Uncharacterized protein n=1 Tax=Thalassoglobus polymorphus TaxID=2527994 RepID=A0A517QMX8_9PLAN|nr:hypothetical protein Mal48_22470 [Thalassoglobus polymorphus]
MIPQGSGLVLQIVFEPIQDWPSRSASWRSVYEVRKVTIRQTASRKILFSTWMSMADRFHPLMGHQLCPIR